MDFAAAKKNKAGVALAVFLAVMCVLFWGVTFVCTKALSEDFSPLEILVYRFLLAYACLWVFYPKLPRVARRREEAFFAAAGFFGVSFYQFVENVAISYTYASNVSIIVSSCPMLTAIATRLILKERVLSARFFVGFVISIFGVTLVTLNGHGAINLSPKGDLLALVAATSWALYSVLVNSLNTMRYPPVFIARRSFFWALVFMLPLIAAGRLFPIESASFCVDFALFKKPLNIMNLAFLGIGASALCFYSWNRACSVLGTVRTTTGLYFAPVITIMFSAAFLGERLSAGGIVGSTLVIAGLAISSWKKQARGH